jgi:hypothetical protein
LVDVGTDQILCHLVFTSSSCIAMLAMNGSLF